MKIFEIKKNFAVFELLPKMFNLSRQKSRFLKLRGRKLKFF